MTKKNLTIISIYYSLIFMAGASFMAYISLYYSEIGLSNSQIGILTAVTASIGLVSQPLLGTISDKSTKKNPVLKVTLLLCALSMWLIPLAGNRFWAVVAAISIFGFFNTTINPLSDTIALELANKGGVRFSRIRMAGSLGFAIMAAVAGNIFAYNIWYMFPVFFTLRIAAYIISYFIPTVEGHKHSKNQAGMMELFKDKKLVVLYSYVFILSCTFGFFNSFHTIYSRQAGISTGIIGIGIMIGSISQFPFMAAFDKVYKKVGLRTILIISGLAYALRWLLYATSLSAATVIALWAIHGLNYMVLYLCLTEYVGHSIPKELHTRGQMMNTIVLLGASAIVGGYLGGLISTAVGLKQVFFGCAAISFAAVAVFAVVSKVMDFQTSHEHSGDVAA